MEQTPVLNRFKFRLQTPQKRNIAYQADVLYTQYRKELKEDFKGRCGYCDSLFSIVKKDYHIDHFVPRRVLKKFPGHAHLIHEYNNLIYSCPSCNGSKSGKWPSEHPDEFIKGEQGFVDPCQDAYGDLFFRDNEGKIHPNNTQFPVASYMYRELKLYLETHSVVWKIEQLMNLIKAFSPEGIQANKVELFEQLQIYLNKHFEMDIRDNEYQE
ncbi:HNH endonuclease [Brevibacillus sp. AG]|uniref:HNH endonuclease n=1 Tax=Brevibacillus sp. AG TaxID=3020891 RepID=UPI00232DDD16|nr:HNH endonuclease [Brevibacillus sp. AG]MDC0764749.1 HNH endonuclease [Brevibacillus sp. AG]